MYCVSKAVKVELSKDALPMLSHPIFSNTFICDAIKDILKGKSAAQSH